MHKLTLFLVVLVVTTLGITVVRRTYSHSLSNQNSQKNDRFQDAKKHFPTAEYNEADLTDTSKNLHLREKQKRHNNFRFVAKHPQPWQTESIFIPEGNFDFPALPVSQNELIVVGRVSDASAHLSESKANVYSEFTVVLSDVLKTPKKEITVGSELTIERLGGYVKYPTGQLVLFRISGWNMPKVGAEYLFFLTSKNNLDWQISTGYEFTEDGVLPLDESSQFEVLKGHSSLEILKQLRDSITQSPK